MRRITTGCFSFNFPLKSKDLNDKLNNAKEKCLNELKLHFKEDKKTLIEEFNDKLVVKIQERIKKIQRRGNRYQNTSVALYFFYSDVHFCSQTLTSASALAICKIEKLKVQMIKF